MKARLFCSINRTPPNRYGYIANLCVAKSARRQGIASNMLHFALESAISDGKMKVKAGILFLFFYYLIWNSVYIYIGKSRRIFLLILIFM